MKSRLTLLEEALGRTWVVVASPVRREVLASTSQRTVTGKHFSTYVVRNGGLHRISRCAGVSI